MDNIVLQAGAWIVTAGVLLMVIIPIDYYARRGTNITRGSPLSSNAHTVVLIAGAVITVAGSLVLAVERILTLII